MTEGFGASRKFVALDLETTGLSAAADRIVEIAAVRFLETGEELDRYQSLVNPERPVSAGAYAVHRLSDDVLAQALLAREVLPGFLAFLGDCDCSALVAHNASFDAGFLGSELIRAGLPVPEHSFFDTLALARQKLPMLASHRLDFLASHFGLDPVGAHRAMADSLLVKELWLRLGGHKEPGCRTVSFRVFDGGERVAVPQGWEELQRAVERGCAVQIEYEGGTRGLAPRSITPRRFESRGGATYLVALCHLDALEKSFRIDRIRVLEFASETGTEVVRVDRRVAGG